MIFSPIFSKIIDNLNYLDLSQALKIMDKCEIIENEISSIIYLSWTLALSLANKPLYCQGYHRCTYCLRSVTVQKISIISNH